MAALESVMTSTPRMPPFLTHLLQANGLSAPLGNAHELCFAAEQCNVLLRRTPRLDDVLTVHQHSPVT